MGTDFFIARLESGAVADVANVEARDAELFHRAVHGFSEGDVHLVFEVGAGLALLSGLRCVGAAEELAEEVAKTGPATGAAAEIKSAEIEMNPFGWLTVP